MEKSHAIHERFPHIISKQKRKDKDSVDTQPVNRYARE